MCSAPSACITVHVLCPCDAWRGAASYSSKPCCIVVRLLAPLHYAQSPMHSLHSATSQCCRAEARACSLRVNGIAQPTGGGEPKHWLVGKRAHGCTAELGGGAFAVCAKDTHTLGHNAGTEQRPSVSRCRREVC